MSSGAVMPSVHSHGEQRLKHWHRAGSALSPAVRHHESDGLPVPRLAGSPHGGPGGGPGAAGLAPAGGTHCRQGTRGPRPGAGFPFTGVSISLQRTPCSRRQISRRCAHREVHQAPKSVWPAHAVSPSNSFMPLMQSVRLDLGFPQSSSPIVCDRPRRRSCGPWPSRRAQLLTRCQFVPRALAELRAGLTLRLVL